MWNHAALFLSPISGPKLTIENHEKYFYYSREIKNLTSTFRHLIRFPVRSPSFITGPSNFSTGFHRLMDYQHALKDHRIELNEEYVIQGPFTRETGYEGAKHYHYIRPFGS